MIFLDTETCGFHGPTVLIQWAKDDGSINLHNVWREDAIDTLNLIEEIASQEVCGFNLSYDWFHLCQTYTVLLLLDDKFDYPNPEEYAQKEPLGRDGPCLKPKAACDIMLHARKGPYQSTMDRDPIKIKRIPTPLAWRVAAELEKRVKLRDIYFARRKTMGEKWKVYDIQKKGTKDIDPRFKDIVLKFDASSKLKALASDALGVNVTMYEDIELDPKLRPKELAYAPFALAVGKPGAWNHAWPEVLRFYITHWGYNERAREYARDDVVYTRGLWEHFGKPEAGDTDSELACMVGATRWRGLAINIKKIEELKTKALESTKLGFNYNSPEVVRKYLCQVLDEIEKAVLIVRDKISTKATVLEEIAKWENHPAAERAKLILKARRATKEIELYDKLLTAGRFHASFTVIGTRSSRMSGGDNVEVKNTRGGALNPQGIPRRKDIRDAFNLALPGAILCGGDFDGFEVSIADAEYEDPILHQELVEGKSFHGIFGTFLFPGMTYEEICATKGKPGEQDKYGRAKNGAFAMFYGGDANTLKMRVGIDLEDGEKAYQMFVNKYKNVGLKRREVFDMFCSMRQPNGIGTRVEWHEPQDFIESMLGFRRYFTLENQICKTLFELANDPPEELKKVNIKVVRRDREQTASGAVQSALYGAAFAIQAANMRAACNHRIQSTGGQITKTLQANIWKHQPCGVHEWIVQPFNSHDEIQCPTHPDYVEPVRITVNETIKSFEPLIPLIAMKWKTGLKSWAEK